MYKSFNYSKCMSVFFFSQNKQILKRKNLTDPYFISPRPGNELAVFLPVRDLFLIQSYMATGAISHMRQKAAPSRICMQG